MIGVVPEVGLLPKEEFRDSGPGLVGQRRRPSDAAEAGAATAEEPMSTPAVTVHPAVTPAQAARITAVRHVGRLPVVDGIGTLQGIVSRAGPLRVFLQPDEDIEEEARRTVVSTSSRPSATPST